MLIDFIVTALVGSFCIIAALGHFLVLTAILPGLLPRSRESQPKGGASQASLLSAASLVAAKFMLSCAADAVAQNATV